MLAHCEERTRARVPLAKRSKIAGKRPRQHDQIRLRETWADSGGRLGEAPLTTGSPERRRLRPGADAASGLSLVRNRKTAPVCQRPGGVPCGVPSRMAALRRRDSTGTLARRSKDRSRLGYLDHDLRAAYTAPFGRLRDLHTFRRHSDRDLPRSDPPEIFLLWNAPTPRLTPRQTPCRPTPIRPPSSASCPVRQARPSHAPVKSGGAGSWWTRETSLSVVSPAG